MCVHVCVCVFCSDEELNKFLDDTRSTVIVEDFVTNLDAVSLTLSHAYIDVDIICQYVM